MLWLWILAVLALLIFLLCLTPVGVILEFEENAVTGKLRIGPWRHCLFPASPQKPEAKAESRQLLEKERKKSKISRPSFSQLKQMAQTLWPPIKKALGKTRRGIVIEPLQLSVCVGGREDPAAAAEIYGGLHGLIWTFMPPLESLLRIPDPHLHVGLDFDRVDTIVTGSVGFHARIGTLLAIAWSVAVPLASYFLREKQHHPHASAAEGTPV